MIQMIGPAPNRKNDAYASQSEGSASASRPRLSAARDLVGQQPERNRQQQEGQRLHRRQRADLARPGAQRQHGHQRNRSQDTRLRSMMRDMPTQKTLDRFIARVEQNAHIEAIQEFYAQDASMQEQFFYDPKQFNRSKT